MISSSEIRKWLHTGDVETANQLLSYTYSMSGQIVEGFKVGRQLGFPTANIQVNDPHKIMPGNGVYAVKADLNGRLYNGMLYIGSRPTLDNGSNITMEVNLFDFSDDIYGQQITIYFMHHIRGDIRFDSLDRLIDQLHQDQASAITLLTNEQQTHLIQ